MDTVVHLLIIEAQEKDCWLTVAAGGGQQTISLVSQSDLLCSVNTVDQLLSTVQAALAVLVVASCCCCCCSVQLTSSATLGVGLLNEGSRLEGEGRHRAGKDVRGGGDEGQTVGEDDKRAQGGLRG